MVKKKAGNKTRKNGKKKATKIPRDKKGRFKKKVK